ncbi:MAG: sulfate permease [Deltaproteobacteria bacterium]|nr:sulfate permease [Deltaproteobacteria bacterium]
MKQQPIFFPKILSTLRNYSLSTFWGDLSGGVIVGIVALPLAIAFAIASGVTPERGLTTAIIAGLLISLLGGSRVQIGGPTGAFVIIVYNIVERYGIDGLIVATIMAGVMLVLMGVLRLGSIIKFIPYPMTVGFTAGIAVVIFSSQLKDFFGFQMGALPADFVEKWGSYFHAFHTLDVTTFGLSVASLLILVLWPKISRKIPGSIIAILFVTAVAQFFHIPVETIGSRFGVLPSHFSLPVWPHVGLAELKLLIGPAFTIAMLGSIESLLSATVADGMIEGRTRSNTELIAQGIANIVSPLFGGIPATGAIARTATNVKNGGRTPVAGIIHAAVLLLIVLVFGAWVRFIPMCVLSAILIVVSWHMSERHAFKALLRAPKMDVVVLLATFFLTIFVDLTVAVEIGLLLSVFLFMKRMTDVTNVRQITLELQNGKGETELRDEADSTSRRQIPPGVAVYEAEGAFFFGVAEMLRDTLDIGKNPPKVILLRMRHVLALDATGIRALTDLRRTCKKMGTLLILAGVQAQPLQALERSGELEKFGRENVLKNFDQALRHAGECAT